MGPHIYVYIYIYIYIYIMGLHIFCFAMVGRHSPSLSCLEFPCWHQVALLGGSLTMQLEFNATFGLPSPCCGVFAPGLASSSSNCRTGLATGHGSPSPHVSSLILPCLLVPSVRPGCFWSLAPCWRLNLPSVGGGDNAGAGPCVGMKCLSLSLSLSLSVCVTS